ncbi:MAG TPA: ribonuclease D [Xanthomonadaceae bacterium]|jgi:ribonuclease D
MHSWIDQPDELAARLAGWNHAGMLALDTEFIRERTWWPQLALVQLAVPGEDALLVDPTVAGMDDLLRPMLADPAIVKLMHSASEDLQALRRGCGVAPSPLFDTQIAAALCGIGAGMGYQKLVETLLGVALPKSETRSDWLKRPLSPAQLAYAADDVLHLHAVHAILDEKLRALGRESWLAEDCARLVAGAAGDEPDPWPHLALRGAQFLDAQAQARLCRLLRWRESQARASDRPKGWILDNELAIALTRKPPANQHAFNALLDGSPKSPRRLRGELWDVLSEPLQPDERDVPLAVSIDGPQKQRLRRLQDAVAAEATRLGIDPGTLASRRALEAMLDGSDWPPALAGWRRGLLEPLLGPILDAQD